MPAKNKSKRLTKIIKKIIFATNLVAILLLLTARLAWHVSPLKTNLFSYIGLGFGIILAINFAYLIFWILFGKWKPALVSVLAMAIAYQPILTFFPLHILPRQEESESIQLLTYNVQGFINESSKKAKETPLLSYIADTDADIVCLQEYFISKTGHSVKTQQDVNRILIQYPYQSIIPLRSSGKHHVYGLACFSKYPIEQSQEVKFTSSFNGAALHIINVNGKRVAIANVHLESNRISDEDKKLYGSFLLNTDDTKLEDITTNIRTRLGPAYRARATQIVKVKEALQQIDYDAAIICGDFNDTPISYAYAKMKEGMVDAFASTSFGPGISYHQDFFWFRIDHIFHTPNLRSYRTKIDHVKYSDHYPVRTYLEINPN